jgi:CubicO group peptidase (beta-lactamase class C family)
VLLVCLLVTIHVPHASPADLSSELSGLLQAEGLSQIAHNNSIGIWIGLRTLNDTAAVALGTRDAAAGTSARVDDIVPAGSLAKSFTAAAVLRLVESGRVSLEDRIAAHLDPYLTRVNHTTLASLFGPLIENTTIRELLSMQVGFPGYDDAVVKRATFDERTPDITPFDYLRNDSYTPNKKRWRCNSSVTCADPPQYNSIAFMLLALMQVSVHDSANPNPESKPEGTWDQFDQKSATLPGVAVRAGRYDDTVFFELGPCSKYPRVVHFYDRVGGDQYNRSCLNGFGFGNIGASALDAATFFYDLLGEGGSAGGAGGVRQSDYSIVSGESVLQMVQWGGVLDGHTWERYGLGLMWLPLQRYGLMDPTTPGIEPYLFSVGHNGEDYGTWTHSAYHPSLGVATSFMINKDDPLYVNHTKQNAEAIFCRAYRAVYTLLGKGALAERAFQC